VESPDPYILFYKRRIRIYMYMPLSTYTHLARFRREHRRVLPMFVDNGLSALLHVPKVTSIFVR